MREAVLMILLAVVSTSAAAEWTEVDSDKTVTFYIEPTTIRRDGDLVKMWELFEYKTAQVRDKTKYLSSKAESEYDCKSERFRTLSISLHSRSMAGGQPVLTVSDAGGWRPVPPGGGIEMLWKIACGKGHC